MFVPVKRMKSPRCKKLWMSLSALALVAGCTPGETGPGIISYLSPFDAPAPVNSDVLALSFLSNAMIPSVVTQTAALFKNDARYSGQSTNGWSAPLKSGQILTGLNSNPLKSSGAAFAHAARLRGSGITIAVSDDRYLSGYDEFVGSNVEVVNNGTRINPDTNSPSTHGTIASAVVLGESNDFIGVAPGAKLLFGTFDTDQSLADLGNRAADVGAIAWNNSWGLVDAFANGADFDKNFNSSQSSQAYLASLVRFAASGVVVFAASNDNRWRHSGLMEGLPFVHPSLEAGWIAAVNGVPTFSAGGDVSSVQLLSSSCMEAARWCMIADGAWRVPDVKLVLEPGNTLVTGSSFAAPQISGALALLQNAFPGLSPHDLRVRLLASADDGFFTPDATVELATGFNKGYSFKYGHGFLDIEAALKPIGGTAMALASGASVSTDTPVLRTGTAFGDAVEVSLANTDVLVKDALSAGFVMPARALSTGARLGSRASALMSRSLTGDLAHERTATVSALNDPFVAFGGNTMDVTASDGLVSASILMPQSGAQSVGLNLTRVLADGPTRVEMGLKLARDDGRIMSLDGTNSAKMASVSLGVAQDIGANAFVALSGEVGMTDLGGSTALGGSGSARFDSAALKIGSSDVLSKGDRLTLGVAMPMAVASGHRTVDLPVYREAAAASFEPVAINLAPENRQVDFEIGYQAALSQGLEMKLSLVRSNNFGNRSGETDSGGAIGFTFNF